MEDLAYRRMLDLYYRTESPLPEPSEIARLIRMRDHAATIRDVLNEFFEHSEDGYRHARCDAEIANMQDKQAKARASAQASVNARSANAQRAPNERSTDVELPTPTPTPITKKEVSVAKATSQQPPGPTGPRVAVASLFEDFWRAYPKKVGKDDARRAFEKRKPDAELAGAMVSAVNAQKQSPQWKKDGGQYIPNPATWLNQGRWQDEPQTAAPLPQAFPGIAKRAAIEAHNNAVTQRYLSRLQQQQGDICDTE